LSASTHFRILARLKRHFFLLTALLVAVSAAFGVWWLNAPRTPTASGPLRQEVYVWQRAWTPAVQTAVQTHGTNFAEIAVLAGEISWHTNRQPQLIRVTLAYEALVKSGRPVGLTLRINPYAGPFTNDAVTEFIAATALRLVTEARTNLLPVAELQIDFDCAESKLDGYAFWIETVRQRVAPLPVTITTLPSWLDSRAFAKLARQATNYVLQVHSAARPQSADAPFTLCDPRAARRAVTRAGRLGVPFRVALPTYGYEMAFDPRGNFLGLTAEGPPPAWPTNALRRRVESNQEELSELMRIWTHRRPQALRGVIWYRLPVATDRHNWDWPTLDRVRRGG
jgi:hypothetical protein